MNERALPYYVPGYRDEQGERVAVREVVDERDFCSVYPCNGAATENGLCRDHGGTEPDPRCFEPGCSRPVAAGSFTFCSRHWSDNAWKRGEVR